MKVQVLSPIVYPIEAFRTEKTFRIAVSGIRFVLPERKFSSISYLQGQQSQLTYVRTWRFKCSSLLNGFWKTHSG